MSGMPLLRRAALVALVVVAALPRSSGAQSARDQQLTLAQAAYDGFDPQRALTLLRTALDPSRGPQDGNWSHGVQLLAQIMTEDQKPAQANVWLLWAFRLNPALPIDSVTFLPEVVAAARKAQQAVGFGIARDSATTTLWEWAGAGYSGTDGGLRVASAGQAPLQVLVEGVGLATPGQNMRLPSGTYTLQASATGYLPTRVVREVLPSTQTVVQFNLVSTAVAARLAADTLLPPTVSDAALRRVALVEPERFGVQAQVCGTGFVADRGGLIATSYRAIRGADRVTVDLGGGRRVTAEVRVAAYDVASDVAILLVPGAPADSMPMGGTPGAGALWAVGFGDCKAATSRRSPVTPLPTRPDVLALGSKLPDGFTGAPLVDRNGNALGLVTGPDSGLALSRVAPVLAAARAAIAARGTLATAAEVSKKENHAYGTLTIRTNVSGAAVRVRPFESWHWNELTQQGPSPLTFTGPMGRYEVTVLVGGAARGQATTATIVAGARTPVNVESQVALGGPEAQPRAEGAAPGVPKKGKSPLPFVLIGGGAAGIAVVAVLAGGGGGGDGGGTPPPGGGATTGSIRVLIPVNPP